MQQDGVPGQSGSRQSPGQDRASRAYRRLGIEHSVAEVRGRGSALHEQQLAELLVLMKGLAHASPLPLRALPLVVIHAVEVRAPPRTGRWRHVLQRLEQRVGDEK